MEDKSTTSPTQVSKIPLTEFALLPQSEGVALLPIDRVCTSPREESTRSVAAKARGVFHKRLGLLVLASFAISMLVLYAVTSTTASPAHRHPSSYTKLTSATSLADASMSPLEAAKKNYEYWSTGKYARIGGQCQATAAKMIVDEFTLSTNADIVNAGIGGMWNISYSTYKGVHGLCAWVKDLEQFDFSTFAGSFVDLGDGRVVQIFTWTPALKTGAKADHSVTDIAISKYRNGRMIFFYYLFSEPETIEKLFIKSIPTHAKNSAQNYQAWKYIHGDWANGSAWENFQAWVDIRLDWAKGKFSGTKCEKAIYGRVSPSFTMVNVPYIRNAGLDVAYIGEDGFCKWVADLEQFDFSKMKHTDFVVSNEEFMMVNEYTPALKGNGAVATHGSKDLAVITWKHGLMQGYRYYCSSPDMWESLFAGTVGK